MMRKRLLDTAEKIEKLSERLASCQEVLRMDSGEAETIANAFADLEEEFGNFLDVALPRLVQSHLSDSEMRDVLHDIGEQFRHVLYHIRDPAFYEYLHENGTER